jgi:hypothetical protein
MSETSTQELGSTSESAPSELSPVVGRSEGGQFVKVTYLRPVPEQDPVGSEAQSRASEAAETPAAGAANQLASLVRENPATTAGAGLGVLGLLALRSWRR